MDPLTILIKRQQRELLGACAACHHAKENYKNLGVEACSKNVATFKKKQCSKFDYNPSWCN